MKIKRKLLVIICGILLISLAFINPAEAAKKKEGIKTEMSASKKKSKKKKKVDKKKKKSNKKSKKKSNKKNNKKSNKKSNKKNNKKNKKSKNKKIENKEKVKEDKKDNNTAEDSMKVIEKEEVEKLPETDVYFPGTGVEGNFNREESYIPNVDKTEKAAATGYTVFCEHTDKSGRLKFKPEEKMELPEKAVIGLISTGENSGKEIELDWGEANVPKAKGKYTLTAVTKQKLIIGDKDYGRVKFAVDIIIE